MQFLLISILVCLLLIAHLSNAVMPLNNAEYRRKSKDARLLAHRRLIEKQCELYPGPDIWFLTTNKKGLIVKATQNCVGHIYHEEYTGMIDIDIYIKHLGKKYSGGVVNGLPSGEGKLSDESYTEVGIFTNGILNGYGEKYHKASGKLIYKGDFVMGIYHGQGIYYRSSVLSNTFSYQGSFENGALNGNGEIFINNELLYKGNFVRDVYHGQGTYFYPNGDKYEGSFRNGLRDGPGAMYYKDGTVVTGTWDRSFYSSGDYKGWYGYMV